MSDWVFYGLYLHVFIQDICYLRPREVADGVQNSTTKKGSAWPITLADVLANIDAADRDQESLPI